jgi:hypothetical protein
VKNNTNKFSVAITGIYLKDIPECIYWIKQLIIKQLHNELRDIPRWIRGKVEELYSFLPTG